MKRLGVVITLTTQNGASGRPVTEAGGGMYSLDLETADPAPCYYVLQKPSSGTAISLNLYFVGVPGITAQTAATNSNVVQMLDAFERI